VLDLDLHRAKVEQERIALASQVNLLTKEASSFPRHWYSNALLMSSNTQVVFSRRLGVVQMIALCGVIAFVGLTRASPSTPFISYALPSSQTEEQQMWKSRRERDEKKRRTDAADSKLFLMFLVMSKSKVK
jgi:hypothetical protein